MASTSSNSGVPPGFRFHPTDEELLHYYLKKKIAFEKFDLEVIREVDLNKIEPWELQERCRIGSAPQNEWYFFSHKDRKYPTGSRTNRATAAGFWKATGRDKCIRNSYRKIGMRKTLVFYRGRAPHGEKTDWIMHEYRLEETSGADDDPHLQAGSSTSAAAAAEDGWVVCRVFKKKAFFKATGEANSDNSGPDDHTAMNAAAQGHGQRLHPLPMRDSLYLHHRDQPASFEQQHHHHQVLQGLYKSDLALHYPPAPAHQHFAHLPVQNLLSDHRTPPVGYDFPVLPGEPPVARPYEMGLDVGACEPMQGHGCEGRDHGSNEWMMLATRLGQDGAAAVDGRYRGAAPEHQVGQLSHHRPGEMDLWGYGK
ncbi:hypothetical protein Taro_049016 [Colocasia esculenta]|uniref:NAC domain-containing protein n=1 Tax=Colocasia esculenta TaxID=4460 RepID=A0A843X9N2_COLES|nr:hypothetical protein [Colocasia esculenta]